MAADVIRFSENRFRRLIASLEKTMACMMAAYYAGCLIEAAALDEQVWAIVQLIKAMPGV